MQQRPPPRLLAVIAVVVASSVAVASPAAADTTTVRMDNGFDFHAATVTLSRGDTVKWRNTGVVGHDVRSTLPGYFRSPGGAGGIDPGDSWSRTFKAAGTFAYLCVFHEDYDMTGTVRVPPRVTLSDGEFRITVATVSSSSTKWRNKVQVQKPGSSTWVTIRTTGSRSVAYDPKTRGTYKFRSAVKNTETGALSGYSPVVSKNY